MSKVFTYPVGNGSDFDEGFNERAIVLTLSVCCAAYKVTQEVGKR